MYNPRTDRWSFIASMTTRRSRSAVATVGNLLYAMGGFDSTNDLASAECFNPQINKVGDKCSTKTLTCVIDTGII